MTTAAGELLGIAGVWLFAAAVTVALVRSRP